ncbi:hypothetical protein Q9L58_002183 [Maublancomyces gigas]|uniref:Uncharacterized protein n=1 Tax=Discina gigas TaxID=1032678 RepID=A0ABR3GS59_9PEZI
MPGVPPNAFEVLKKVGRSLFGRNKKKSKKVAEEPTAATGESSTEATPPVLETVPETVPVTAPPAVESTPALEPVTDAPKQGEIAPPVPEAAVTSPVKEPPAPIAETPAPAEVPKIEAPPVVTTAVEVVKPVATPAPNAAIEAN